MYISLCGVDPQYKLPVSTLERLSHPVSQTGPFVVEGPAQQKSSFLAITFEQNIIGEIHESKTFEMSFDICWYLAFASQIVYVDVRARTDIQTHKTTTVTLAAHARRGLITGKLVVRQLGTFFLLFQHTIHASPGIANTNLTD